MFLRGQCLDFVHIYSQKLLSLAWDIFYMSQNEWTTRAGYTRILCYPQNTMTFESFMDKSRKTKTRRCKKTSPNNNATITNAIMDIFKGHTFPFFLFLSIQTLTKYGVILTWRMFMFLFLPPFYFNDFKKLPGFRNQPSPYRRVKHYDLTLLGGWTSYVFSQALNPG